MNTTPKMLLAVVAGSLLLAGCTTNGTRWEYKTVSVLNWEADAKLNQIAAEDVVAYSRNEGDSNKSTFVLKRKK
jgi:outer membrane murein-binding lipoprotein Lpp